MSKRTLSHIEEKVADLELQELAKGEISPVTIILDPEDGKHSGGKWLAYQSWPNELPKNSLGWGLSEKFWQDHDDLKLPIGKGKTPDEALEDLKVKAKKYYESW
jgi:hypothetical protein